MSDSNLRQRLRTYDGDTDNSQPTGRTRGQTQTQNDSEKTDSASDTSQVSCPECSGELITEENEQICTDCGLVVDDQSIDRGPEWRAFNHQEKQEKSRVGSPTTEMMHDKGLSTNIDWRDKDAHGNSLSGKQRQKMQRLRKWNERYRTQDAKDRNLKQALGEIDRMASALGIKDTTRETASVLYRRALNEDLLPGRSIEGVATASLHAATRMEQTPRTLAELESVSRVQRDEIRRAYRYIVRELNLEVQPADPMEYLPRFVSKLNASQEVENEARRIIKKLKDESLHSGKAPAGIAAASIYAAGVLANEKYTQSEIAEESNVTEVTIRDRCSELWDIIDIRWLTD